MWKMERTTHAFVLETLHKEYCHILEHFQNSRVQKTFPSVRFIENGPKSHFSKLSNPNFISRLRFVMNLSQVV